MAQSIGEIDKNLKVETNLNLPDVRWRDAHSEQFSIYGLYSPHSPGYFRRMPTEIAKQVSNGVFELHKHTSGGRIRFRTDSPYIAIKVYMPDGLNRMPHMPLTGSSGFDLYTEENGVDEYCASFIPPIRSTDGYESVFRFPSRREREILIHMPLYDCVETLYIGLAADASLAQGKPYASDKPILFYGSSITQGGCASRPGNGYSNMVSRILNLDHINLGFSGNAKGEDAMIDYLASLDVSSFVCDYDHNAPNYDHLKATHWPLYQRFRAANPDTPVLFLTKPDIRPGQEENNRRRELIRSNYEAALAAGDKHVGFIDGETFFASGPLRFDCTVDGAHPNDIGFLRMALPVAESLRGLLGI